MFPSLKKAAWFKGEGGAYFVSRPFFKKVLPTPVEGESVYARCGVPLFPDKKFRLACKEVYRLQQQFAYIKKCAGGSVLITKRTANNRRLGMLHAAFPQAKFIRLLRDGRDVAHSLSRVDWWDKHTVWWSGKTPIEMERDGEHRLSICARNWIEENRVIEDDLQVVPSDQRLNLRFENLTGNPSAELDRVLSFLNLEMSTEYSRFLNEFPKTIAVEPAWSKNWTKEESKLVMSLQRPFLEKFQYL